MSENDASYPGGHLSHVIATIPPRHTGSHQQPIRADHERNVHFNPSRTQVLVLSGRVNRPRASASVLAVEYIGEGSNCLLDPPALRLSFQGAGSDAVVTVESLLYAIREMQLATGEESDA